MVSPRDPADVLTITIAETLHDRHQRASEILWLAIPMQALLIVCVLSLVWFGVNYGLRIMQPLTRRLAAREHELGPISDADVPEEILPLTRTIDALFARLRAVLELQERFIADAAHQLRTPLAGLSIHVERALADPRPEVVDDALSHVARLTQRATRTSSQLLAMTRAQAPEPATDAHEIVDLTALAADALNLRVHEALRAGIDLGFEGPDAPRQVRGDAASLHDLLDNLIENAMRYAGRGSRITVAIETPGDAWIRLSVEDNGPGVADDLLPRLGERFFRVPGSVEGGTGLGLAIVARIAEQHQASLIFEPCMPHGLRVRVDFPAVAESA
jgi:two-component system sensor histidine kinase TctE